MHSTAMWSRKCFWRTVDWQFLQRKTSRPPRLAVVRWNGCAGSLRQSAVWAPQCGQVTSGLYEQAHKISHGLVVQVFQGGLHGLQGLDDGRLAMRPQGGRKLHPFQISLTVGQVQKMLVGHGFLWSKVLGQSLS